MEEEKKEGEPVVTGTGQHHVYIQSEEHGWIPAVVRHMDQKKQQATVVVDRYEGERAMMNSSGEGDETVEVTVKLKDYQEGLLPLQNVNEQGELVSYEDMVDMPYMHEVSQKLR